MPPTRRRTMARPKIDPALARSLRVSAEADDPRVIRARLAVERFRRMVPGLTGFAKMITRDDTVRVQLSAGSPHTDGKVIYLRPPIELGDDIEHQRTICEKRDVYGPICPACMRHEEIMTGLYHEIAHIAFDTFAPVPDADKRDLLMRALSAAGDPSDSSTRAGKIKRRVEAGVAHIEAVSPTGLSYMGMAQFISPYFPMLINGMEDWRVNAALQTARPGTRAAFTSRYLKVLEQGVTEMDGSVWFWRDRPLNSQLIVGVLLKLCGYPYGGGLLDEKVAEALDSEDMRLALRHAATVRSARGVYEMAFGVLEAARAHGFLVSDEDPEDDAPEPVFEKKDRGETGDSDDKDDSSDSDSSGGSGDTDEAPDEDSTGSSSGDDDEEADGDSEASGSAPDDGDEDGTEEGDEADGEGSGAGASDPSADADDEDEDEAPGDGTADVGEPENDDAHGDSPTDGDDEDAPMGDGGEDADDASGGEEGDDDFDSDDSAGTGEQGDDAEGSGEAGGLGSGAGAGMEGEEGDAEGDTDDFEADGEPDEALTDIEKFLGHDNSGYFPSDSPPGMPDEEAGKTEDIDPERDTAEIDRAIVQGEHFDRPSHGLFGVQIAKNGDGSPFGPYNAWSHGESAHTGMEEAGESILGPSLLRMRLAFADNHKRKKERNLKAGRINSRTLGRRAATGDERLFYKPSLPGKKDYFVVIGLDISGSTGGSRVQRIKSAALAQAELLHRTGVKFAVYAHTGGPSNAGTYDLHIYTVKSPEDPWTNTQRNLLRDLYASAANLDGHTLEFYRKVCDRQVVTDKVIMYYTDGAMPAENYHEELSVLYDEMKVIDRKGYVLVAVGVNNIEPESKYGIPTVRLDSIEDVPNVVKFLETRLVG